LVVVSCWQEFLRDPSAGAEFLQECRNVLIPVQECRNRAPARPFSRSGIPAGMQESAGIISIISSSV